MNKRYLVFVLAFMVGIQSVLPVGATSIDDVQNEKSKTEGDLSIVNSQIDKIINQQMKINEEINQMDNTLVEILTSISICQDEILEKEEKIQETTVQLEVAIENEAIQYDAMKKRIKFMYEKGDTGYLNFFLEANSFGDLLNKATYIEKLYEYDRTLLKNYSEQKNFVQDTKKQLEEEEAELLAANYELEQEQIVLEETIATKRKTVSNFDQQLVDAKAQVATYKKKLVNQTAKIRELEEAEAEQKRKEAEEKKAQEQSNSPEATSNTPGGQSVTGDSSENDGAENDDSDDGEDTDTSNTDDSDSDSSDTKESGTDSETKVDGSRGQQIANYGCGFVGYPYKFGGTSLTTGVDCSGFTQAVFAHFGITIPRDSTSQRLGGKAVSYSDALPGDIICYAGHVALYLGGGRIVHASTEASGIKYGTASYRTILGVRRYW